MIEEDMKRLKSYRRRVLDQKDAKGAQAEYEEFLRLLVDRSKKFEEGSDGPHSFEVFFGRRKAPKGASEVAEKLLADPEFVPRSQRDALRELLSSSEPAVTKAAVRLIASTRGKTPFVTSLLDGVRLTYQTSLAARWRGAAIGAAAGGAVGGSGQDSEAPTAQGTGSDALGTIAAGAGAGAAAGAGPGAVGGAIVGGIAGAGAGGVGAGPGAAAGAGVGAGIGGAIGGWLGIWFGIAVVIADDILAEEEEEDDKTETTTESSDTSDDGFWDDGNCPQDPWVWC